MKNSEFPLLTQKPSLTEPQNIPPTVDATILVWGNGDLDLEKEGWWEDMSGCLPESLSLT